VTHFGRERKSGSKKIKHLPSRPAAGGRRPRVRLHEPWIPFSWASFDRHKRREREKKRKKERERERERERWEKKKYQLQGKEKENYIS
jgi:hypothetical protein